MNRDYRLTAKKHEFVINEIEGDNLRGFPIEEARFRSAWCLVITTAVVMTGYEWALSAKAHVAVPLVLQFFIGFAITGIFQV